MIEILIAMPLKSFGVHGFKPFVDRARFGFRQWRTFSVSELNLSADRDLNCKQAVRSGRKEDVRPMICRNCGQIWSGRIRLWPNLHVLRRLQEVRLLPSVLLALHSAMVTWLIFFTYLSSIGSFRNVLLLSFLKRMKVRGYLVSVLGVLLCAGSDARANGIGEVEECDKKSAVAESEKKDIVLSGGWWTALAAGIPLADSINKVITGSVDTGTKGEVDGGWESTEYGEESRSKGSGIMISGGWWKDVPSGLLISTSDKNESTKETEAKRKKPLSLALISKGDERSVMLSGGWWAAARSGRMQSVENSEEDGFFSDVSPYSVAPIATDDISVDREVGLTPSDWDGRYTPSQEDLEYLRKYGYSERPREDLYEDVATQTDSVLFPPEDREEVDEYDSLYQPINRVLGVFDSHEIWAAERDRLRAVATGYMHLPFVSTFEPSDAHIKAGPLYLEFLYAGVGVLYSDFEGDRVFPEGQEDGWMSMLELGLRGSLRITDQFSITLSTRLVYLPGVNRFGFALDDGSGIGGSFLIDYQFYWGTWDFLVYDHFRAYTPSYFLGLGEQARERSGRYSFGINSRGRRSNNYFNDGFVYFVNTIGGRASTPFLRENWDLLLQADHSDYWTGFNFEYPRVRDHFGVRLGYDGMIIPFSPYVSYDVYSFDRMRSFYNTAYIGGRGRLTRNVDFNARAGYLWTTNREPERKSPLWRVGLTHQINENTWHSLWAGQTFRSSDVTNETALAEYIRYQINHQFSSRLWGFAYAQFGRQEDLVLGTPVTDREIYGGRLDYQLFDYTRISGSGFYEKQSSERRPDIVQRRWIYRASVEQQIYWRTTARFYYQFENLEGRSNFDEHVLSLTLRRYF